MRLYGRLAVLGGPCAMLLLACGSAAASGHAAAGQSSSLASTAQTPGVAATVGAAPAARGIANRPQTLRFSGVASGLVTSAEVRTCGSSGGLWVIQLSNIGLQGATASLSLTVQPYGGPATYQPQGSLMLIVNQRASFYGVSSGSVKISDPQKGSLDVTFVAGGSSVRVTGDWAC
jgi:hypothetical protein